MKKQVFPPGWNEERVRKVIAYYDNQTEDEALAEFEAAFDDPHQTMMFVPSELIPAIAALIDAHQQKALNSQTRSRRSPQTRSKKSAKSDKR